MTRIFTEAPIWVWPLLILLILVGLRARKDRRAPAVLIYFLPLLGILALRSTAALPAAAWIWSAFALAYLLGVWGGHLVQARWLIRREGRFVHLKGESLTLAVMMLVFWANFAGGFLQATAPQVYTSAFFQVIFVAILALSAGSFAGRALLVWRAV